MQTGLCRWLYQRDLLAVTGQDYKKAIHHRDSEITEKHTKRNTKTKVLWVNLKTKPVVERG